MQHVNIAIMIMLHGNPVTKVKYRYLFITLILKALYTVCVSTARLEFCCAIATRETQRHSNNSHCK